MARDREGGPIIRPKTKKATSTTPTSPLPLLTPVPLTPFNWNSGTGRQPMDIEKIMGAAMPLAGTPQLPTSATPAPPISGNFWDTVVSPSVLMNTINNQKQPFDVTSLLTDQTGGKTGTPVQSVRSGDDDDDGRPSRTTTGNDTINPAMFQMFLKSGLMGSMGNVFSPGGVQPQGGPRPFY